MEKGHQVTTLSRRDGDIADPDTLQHLAPVDHVFHLAARTFVPDSWKDPAGFLRCNVVGTANVLAYCRRAACSLTFVSAYVYGRPEKLPVDEDSRPRPNNPYALSKYLAEQLCAFSAQYEGVATTVVRPFNIFGPNQADHFLMPRIIRQVKAGGPVRVMDLSPKRDYLHIDDLVDLLLATLKRGDSPFRVVNAGSGESHSVGEIADIIQDVAGTDFEVVDEAQPRYEELHDVRADVSRARRELGWSPRLTFRQGIESLVAPGAKPK